MLRISIKRAPSIALLLAITAGAFGCSGNAQRDETSDDSEVRAAEANATQFGLKEHVFTQVPASKENQRTLGIATWDAFAGADDRSGFQGTVFYASDAQGDVKYGFAVDLTTKEVVFMMFGKDGSQVKDAKLDSKTYDQLMVDIRDLKSRAESRDTSNLSAAANCGITLAIAGIAAVLVIPVMMATPYVMAVGMGAVDSAFFALEIESVALENFVMMTVMGATGATILYGMWKLGSTIVHAPGKCIAGFKSE